MNQSMKHIFIFACILMVTSFTFAPKREYYQIKVYTVTSKTQEERVDKFLKEAYVPALHRAGIAKVGVLSLSNMIPSTLAKRFSYLYHSVLSSNSPSLKRPCKKISSLKPADRIISIVHSTIYLMHGSSQFYFTHFPECLKWKSLNMLHQRMNVSTNCEAMKATPKKFIKTK